MTLGRLHGPEMILIFFALIGVVTVVSFVISLLYELIIYLSSFTPLALSKTTVVVFALGFALGYIIRLTQDAEVNNG